MRLRLLAVLSLGALLLGACSSGAAPTTGGATSPPSAATTGSGDASAPGPHVIRVAAAADLRYAMEELIAAYGRINPATRIDVTYGSSGTFFMQLQNGAPFDVYFSADIAYPRQLSDAGLAVSAPRPYAIGKIVLWVPMGSPIDVEHKGMAALLDPAAQKVAIADPAHAPYGKAAVAAMERAGLYDQVKDRLVLGENISQAAQFVQSGAADIGVVALSLAVAPPMKSSGRYWSIPVDLYPAISQGALVLKAAQDPAAATQFLDFVLGTSGRLVLDRFGFELPQ